MKKLWGDLNKQINLRNLIDNVPFLIEIAIFICYLFLVFVLTFNKILTWPKDFSIYLSTLSLSVAFMVWLRNYYEKYPQMEVEIPITLPFQTELHYEVKNPNYQKRLEDLYIDIIVFFINRSKTSNSIIYEDYFAYFKNDDGIFPLFRLDYNPITHDAEVTDKLPLLELPDVYDSYEAKKYLIALSCHPGLINRYNELVKGIKDEVKDKLDKGLYKELVINCQFTPVNGRPIITEISLEINLSKLSI